MKNRTFVGKLSQFLCVLSLSVLAGAFIATPLFADCDGESCDGKSCDGSKHHGEDHGKGHAHGHSHQNGHGHEDGHEHKGGHGHKDGHGHAHPSIDDSSSSKEPSGSLSPSLKDGFWGKFNRQGQVVEVATLSKSPDQLKGKTLVLKGDASKVCEHSGCWLQLKDGSDWVKVQMKGHAFAVPKEIVGKPIEVQGEVVSKELSEKEKQLIANSPSSPLAKNAKYRSVEVIATGVRLR